jgi:hypothetical protein
MAPFELEIARARHEDMLRTAARRHLVGLSRCCQPPRGAVWRAAVRATARRLGAIR